jgi:hypothetical protein
LFRIFWISEKFSFFARPKDNRLGHVVAEQQDNRALRAK